MLIYDFPLPDGWREERLKDVTQRRRGYSWEKGQETFASEEGAVPVLRIPNVGDTLDLTDLLYLRGVKESDLQDFGVDKGWIVFVASNGNPDRIGDGVLIDSEKPLLFASFLQGITSAKPEELNPLFLSHWMHLHRVHEIWSKTSQQTTGLANFAWSAVKNLPLRFPSDPKEQSAVLDCIAQADATLSAARAELEAARRTKTALLLSLFSRGVPGRHTEFQDTKIGRLPAEWEVRTIKSTLSEPPFNGVSPESRPDPPGTPILNVSCVKKGRCNIEAVTYVDVDARTIEDCAAKRGDFYVLRGNGNRESVASGGLLEVEPPKNCIFSDKLIRLRFNESVVENFIPLMWESESFLRRLQAKAESGSGLWMMSKRDIRRQLFAYPPIAEQEQIVSTLRCAQKNLDACQTKITALSRLKQSLLQNLLTGRLRVRA